MKSLAFKFRRVLPVVLVCAFCVLTANAQTGAQVEAAPALFKFVPPDRSFMVSMPGTPASTAEQAVSGELKVEGQRHQLHQDKAEYVVWSLKAVDAPASLTDDEHEYLDRAAEIAWNLLIKPRGGKVKRLFFNLPQYNLIYDREMPVAGSYGIHGRSYRLQLDKQRGETRIYVAGSQIYIIAATGELQEADKVLEFINSFRLILPKESPGVGMGVGMGIGPGMGGGGGGVGDGSVAGPTDYTRKFRGAEVTQKAVIRSKPKPDYTESARKFGVYGTVRLRIVLSASGEVTNITPVSRLPHGLTVQAIEAARKIKFNPAMKDGHIVSQYATIEYNFNFY
ncbi:MAG TPA: energy transducer TonB [Pyrinomonadaceae bacterium]|nr:energy transducer TonB [Pyrinomonadaceae bacterium]